MYDLIITGGGPAGLTAGIYAKRSLLKTLLLEKGIVGGQVNITDIIENYPGFPSLSGTELVEKFQEHVDGLDLEVRQEDVLEIEDRGREKVLKTTGGDISASAVIIASGASPKGLGVPGEKEFRGRGVSYCGTCDGPFFRNQRVLIVGGGDTAIKEAIYLSKIADKVYVAHRRDQLRAEKILQERVLNIPNVEMLWNSILLEIKGEKGVEMTILQNKKTGEKSKLDIDGVFIFVGILPNVDFVDVEKDKWGFIKTNENMETSVKGIFAAGDCRVTPLRQVATAVGDGAIAAFTAEKYIEEMGDIT
ncbi:MAG: thioredoxin-disulfide reductase [Thermodesulfobacteriota bacterium]